MELSISQKQRFFEDGFIKVSSVISQKQVNMALRSINHSLSQGLDPARVDQYRASSYCPELRNLKFISDLLFESGAMDLAESLTEKGNLKLWGSGQIALRFPVMARPADLSPHLDGMYFPGNKVRNGKLETFTMLVGVMLSDTPNRYWGNFTVWPGTHRLYEQYFRERGTKGLWQCMPKVRMPDPVQVLGKAGDVLLCHYQLAHTVVSNVSPYIRYATFFRLKHVDHSRHKNRVLTDIWLEWPGVREVI